MCVAFDICEKLPYAAVRNSAFNGEFPTLSQRTGTSILQSFAERCGSGEARARNFTEWMPSAMSPDSVASDNDSRDSLYISQLIGSALPGRPFCRDPEAVTNEGL
jgi:hypothetical protein